MNDDDDDDLKKQAQEIIDRYYNSKNTNVSMASNNNNNSPAKYTFGTSNASIWENNYVGVTYNTTDIVHCHPLLRDASKLIHAYDVELDTRQNHNANQQSLFSVVNRETGTLTLEISHNQHIDGFSMYDYVKAVSDKNIAEKDIIIITVGKKDSGYSGPDPTRSESYIVISDYVPSSIKMNVDQKDSKTTALCYTVKFHFREWFMAELSNSSK